MITITQSFNIDVARFPYTYEFSNNGLTCISFSNPTGSTSSPTLTTTITSNSSSCINNAPITLRIIDANSCAEQITWNLVDPCSTFTVNDITQTDDLFFTVSGASSGCPSLNFNWDLDYSKFEVVGTSSTAFSSSIQLRLKDGVRATTSSSVQVAVTNCNGCVVNKSLSFVVCIPTAANVSRALTCFIGLDGASYHQATIQLPLPANCASPIVWGTIKFFTRSSLTVTHLGNGLIRVVAANNVPAGTYTINYTINTVNGVISNQGTITIVVGPDCAQEEGLSGVGLENISHQVDFAGATAGDIIEIPIFDKVRKNNNKAVDWTSWTLNATPNPLATSIVLKSNVSGEQYIEYTVPSPVPTQDAFSWTIADEDGIFASSSYVALVEPDILPIAVADAACVVLGGTVSIPVTANDTTSRPVNPSGVNITTGPTNGSAFVNPDGTISFFAPYEEKLLGANGFNYSLTDVDGNTSSTALVTVTVITAGEGTTNSLCYPYSVTPAVVTPLNYIPQPRTGGGTWTKLSVYGPAAPGTPTGTIDFSALTTGVATYRYTVTNAGCSDNTEVTFNVNPHLTVVNDECATASTISFGGKDLSSILGSQTIKATCPGPVAPTLSVTALPSSWNAGTYASDVWYEFTAPAAPVYSVTPIVYENYPITISVEGSAYGQTAGIKAPAIAVYTGTCGALVLDRAASVTANKQNVSVTVPFGTGTTSKTYFVRVSSTTGNEGTFNVRLNGQAEYISSDFTNPNTFNA